MTASYLAAAASGILLASAFEPFSAHWAAWVALVPLLGVFDRARTPFYAGVCAGLAGLVFSLIDLRFLYATIVTHAKFHPLSGLSLLVALSGVMALYWFAFGMGARILVSAGFPRSVVTPIAWCAMEYGRAVLFTGFPWDLAGYSQAWALPLIQIVDITGVYGISFLIALVNCLIYETGLAVSGSEPFPFRTAAVTGVLIVATLLYGFSRLDEFSAPTQAHAGRIAALQGNIPQELKWDESARDRTFEIYERLAKTAAKQGAELIVWPETAAPVLFGAADMEWKQVVDIGARVGVPMVVGAPRGYQAETGPKYFNSALLISGDGIHDAYDKKHLVPFGEYMPLSWLLPLGPGLAARNLDYSAGETMTVMTVEGLPPLGILICYEAVFPELAREAYANGARVLINITNDAWFGESAAPYQHLVMSGFRAIEQRVSLIRAANTGVSAAFSPTGRTSSTIPLNSEGMLIAEVYPPGRTRTFYSLYGDAFAWCCVGMATLMGCAAWRTRDHRRPTGADTH